MISIVTNDNPENRICRSDDYVDSISLLGNNLIATKYAERGVIYVWDFERLTEQDEENLEVVCSLILNWSITDEYHIELAWNNGEHLVRKIWLVANLQCTYN